MSSSVYQTDPWSVLRDHHQHIQYLLRSDGSNRWILVGDGSDPESPPFQNGWRNLGGAAPVAFKRFLNWVHLRGSFAGGPDNSVVFTLPQAYWPLYREHLALGQLTDGSGGFACYVDVDGTVNYVTAFAF